MIIAVIPARGGSKRIPRKNIKSFAGKPIIAWSIAAALESKCFDKVIVSTDDPEVAETSRKFGAEIPFIRPDALSDDYTGTVPVVAHAITELASSLCITAVCCIYATAPLIQSRDIRRGYELLQDSQCDYAFSVTSYEFPIQRALRITEENRVEMYNPQHCYTRSQDLEGAWHDAGQFYWGTTSAWLEARQIYSRNSIPVLIPRILVQDIDTQEDWERAEWLFQMRRAIRDAHE